MKIILNILTHGDEKIGLKVVKEINKLNINKNTLVVQVANKKAFELRKRFIDQDLNRSFPGKKNGNYEERTAYKILPAILSADIVIDIHSTTSDLKDAIIVTKFNKTTKEYIQIIQPKYVLVMKITNNNALISQAKVGLAFEYGKDSDLATLKKIVLDLKRLFYHIGIIDTKTPKSNKKATYFDVVSEAAKPKGYRLLKKIKNYKIVRKGEAFATNGKNRLIAEESFYPILFGGKSYKDIFGFKGKIKEVKE